MTGDLVGTWLGTGQQGQVGEGYSSMVLHLATAESPLNLLGIAVVPAFWNSGRRKPGDVDFS